MASLESLYREQDAKLDKIAGSFFTHRKHLCENLKDYEIEIQENVSAIQRIQLNLLIQIIRQDPARLVQEKTWKR